MFNPSFDCTLKASAFLFLVSFFSASSWLSDSRPSRAEDEVVSTWSRMSYRTTESSNGRTKCTPGYKVPGRVPAVWLTLMPPIPLGTTTMPAARVSGSQAARNAHLAVVQFSCGFSTPAPWVDGRSVDAPSDSDEMPDKEPGAIRRNWRCYWTTWYRFLKAWTEAAISRRHPV